jgi:hypothetical protein
MSRTVPRRNSMKKELIAIKNLICKLLSMAGSSFSKTEITVKVGDQVVFENDDEGYPLSSRG